MGFRVGQRTYVLQFGEGTYFDGAEIRMRPATIATVDEVEKLHVSEGFPIFLEHVESWNLEDRDGNPLPLELEACRNALEPAERTALARAWFEACIGVSAPLDPPSGDGGRSPDGENAELSIPMEAL